MTSNDWEGYGTCPVCLAAPDEPCLDTDDGHEKAKAHRTRGALTDDPIYQRAIRDAVQRYREVDKGDGCRECEERVIAAIKGEQA